MNTNLINYFSLALGFSYVLKTVLEQRYIWTVIFLLCSIWVFSNIASDINNASNRYYAKVRE